MKDFYITIPSTSPYPNNTSTDFTAQLESPIYLNSSYEIALTEINFKNGYRHLNAIYDRQFRWVYIPNASDTLKQSQDVWNYVSNIVTLEIPNDSYKNIQEILRAINQAIKTYTDTLDMDLEPINLIYLERRDAIYCRTKDANQYINFNYKLSHILGLSKDKWYGHLSPKPKGNTDFVSHLSHLHVYCDIIEPQYVNNQKHNLLRQVITAKEDIGTYVNKIFNKPYYKKIQHRTFASIRIWLLDELGQIPSIGDFEVIVVLHLKPV